MKKLVSSVLAASMVLSLAACGSSASTDTASSSEAASTSTAATTEAAGEGSGAYTGTPIKIGGIGPVTGGAPFTVRPLRTPRSWPSRKSTPPTAAMSLSGSSRTMSMTPRRASTPTTP